ncbi:hypothetical protein K2173_009474 [Erythroxylum novogranatense]|uniref:DUF4371 domain-containing protein n=1 Tax=Erythroxylum novogranatense TaxID=1862640 RepID=A0AAV8U4A0_9ROSI|nr:hypothetical protein K2173_009474 [Erythroxylum novogranatense]
MGKSPNSRHNACVKSCNALMAQSQHIERSLNKQCSQIVMNNRLRLKTSIDVVRWLTFQGCAFRGNDESIDSLNRGNFIEMVKLLATYDKNVANVVLENAPGNAQYISPSVQKEILYVFARRIRAIILEDIGNAKYCIIIDESRDGSKREQMSIVLRGQGYDGASNMRGEWNGLQNILGITHDLCQALQRRSQDILNAISLISTTKILIQKLRESGWETLFNKVKMFCERHNVEIPDLNAPYFPGRSRRRAHDVSIEHHYRVNLFIAIIDTQLQELNSKFSDSTMEFLSLSSTLDPRDNFILLNVDHICELANKFYPDDFSEQEKLHLRIQAQHYELDVPHHCELKQLSTISELCQGLVKTRKSLTYPLIDRLIRLTSPNPTYQRDSYWMLLLFKEYCQIWMGTISNIKRRPLYGTYKIMKREDCHLINIHYILNNFGDTECVL